MANYVKPVVFKVGDELYGVDINLVQSIEKEVAVVPVPNSMKYVKGIVNLRGEVIPVYSLKKKFGMTADAAVDNAIIIATNDVKIALEVDEVVEISDMNESQIVDMPKLVCNEETIFMDRVANINGRLVVLMDVNRLLSGEEISGVKKLTEELA